MGPPGRNYNVLKVNRYEHMSDNLFSLWCLKKKKHTISFQLFFLEKIINMMKELKPWRQILLLPNAAVQTYRCEGWGLLE